MLRYIVVFVVCFISSQAVGQVTDSIDVPMVKFDNDYYYTAIDSLIYRDSVAFNRVHPIDDNRTAVMFYLGRFEKNTGLTDYERKKYYHLSVSFGNLSWIWKPAGYVGYLYYRGYKVLVMGSEAYRIIEKDTWPDAEMLRLYFYDLSSFPLGTDDSVFQSYQAKIHITYPKSGKNRHDSQHSKKGHSKR